MQVGFLTRCFEFERKFQLGVAALVGFRIDGSVRLMSDMALWTLIGEELGDQAVIDEGLPKSRAEFLVRGHVHTPGGAHQPTCPVKVRVGAVEKTLYVIGDRTWHRGVPTEPVPFTTMELTWARAYGGGGYARNPAGTGHAPDASGAHPLPNIETPGRLVTAPSQEPEPAGFMPYGFEWPQRREKLGTFDDEWLREDFPGYPRDIDWTTFNVAQPDQRQPEAYVGDETIECVNLHPERPKLEGRLPSIHARAFLTFKTPQGPGPLIDVPMRATTVWLFPHLETGVLVFHGAHQVGEDDAHDVAEILLAAENLGSPRTLDHYQRIMTASRTQDPTAVLPLVSGVGLVPDDCVGVGTIDAEIAAFQPDGLLLENQFRRAHEAHEEARAQLEAAGLDTSLLGPPPPPPEKTQYGIDDLAALIERGEQEREKAEREAQAGRAQLKERAQALCAEYEVDYDTLFLELAGPPAFDAEARLAQLDGALASARALGCPLPEQEAQIQDPEFRARVRETEVQLKEAYRLSAHMNPKVAPSLEGAVAEARRRELLELTRGGQSAGGRDWTGIDLRGEDLSGADFTGAFLECANLTGCNLSDVNFTRAVLASATLDGAILSGAKLAGANLGRASLKNAVSDREIDLAQAVLDQIDLRGARMFGLNLHDAMLRESRLDGASLEGIRGEGVTFYKCSLVGTSICRATLPKASFIEADASGLIATGANLEGATFYDVRADGAKLDHARLSNFRATGKTSLLRSDFEESALDKSNFRGVDLTESRFTRCDVSGGDLSEAVFVRADLRELVARGTLMIRTDFTEANLAGADLMNAILSKANLTGTDLSNASLFGADLARARSDGGTKLDGADQRRVRVHPVRAT